MCNESKDESEIKETVDDGYNMNELKARMQSVDQTNDRAGVEANEF